MTDISPPKENDIPINTENLEDIPVITCSNEKKEEKMQKEYSVQEEFKKIHNENSNMNLNYKEINNNRKYKHPNDNGNLLEGLRQGKKVIICDKCFKIFGYKEYNNWKCPECGYGFNEKSDKYNTAISYNKIKNIYQIKNSEKEKEMEKENNKVNNIKNNINHHRFTTKDNNNIKKYYHNKININESIEELNKNNNNNKTSILSTTKENNNNESINNIKSKRIISSKLFSQENRLKRGYNNTNSNIIESKNIIKKANSKKI